MHRIDCAEVWGGIRDFDGDVATSGITATLFSRAADGGKGGDVYYVSVCSSDLLTRVVLADVMGHGEAVAETSQWLHDAVVAWMNRGDGEGILRHLNALSYERGLHALTTAAVVAFYRRDSRLYFSYAGHPRFLMKRRSGGRWEAVDAPDHEGLGDLPLGVEADTPYHQHDIPLTSGDRLFLYTDGVLEAPNASGGLFGLERLASLLDETGEVSLPEVKAAVVGGLRGHTGGTLSHDDVTFMAVEIR